MRLTVLSVAYPFAPVGPDATGGAEQILTALDAALVRAGHRSIVVACAGSTTQGTLIETRRWQDEITDDVRRHAWREHRQAFAHAVSCHHVDLVHMHGVDFYEYMPDGDVPTLATLHLPPTWYPPEIFNFHELNRFIHCVSQSQARDCPAGARMLPPIQNGIDVDRLTIHLRKREFAIALGRICPEKGFHLAIEAAKLAGLPLLLAGKVFPYTAHIDYFENEIRPRLDRSRRFIGPIGLRMKRRLLTQARCLLVPSLVPETSSLMTMEALACGTPVIAFRSGALPELICEGRTGFVVNDVEEMAAALARIDTLDPETCRQTARQRFSATRMVRDYFNVYEHLRRSANKVVSSAC